LELHLVVIHMRVMRPAACQNNTRSQNAPDNDTKHLLLRRRNKEKLKSKGAKNVLTEWGKKYRVIRNECRGFNNLSYTIHLR
jgi:hypothetical protein